MTSAKAALRAASLVLILSCRPLTHGNAAPASALIVPQCFGVSLSAAYLAQVTPTAGPGFLVTVTNDTDAPVTLAAPIPSSAHWYAQAPGGRWLWRASSGAGGALVNALRERGPVFAYRRPSGLGVPAELVTIPAHQHAEWAESMRDHPMLRFRPGCQRCRNPGEAQFRAVLAYASLPPDNASRPALLTCGLRSGLIVMPPLE